jgi:hypothetical protein
MLSISNRDNLKVFDRACRREEKEERRKERTRKRKTEKMHSLAKSYCEKTDKLTLLQLREYRRHGHFLVCKVSYVSKTKSGKTVYVLDPLVPYLKKGN